MRRFATLLGLSAIGAASLRVTAHDTHGNSVQQTALHAYRLR